MGFAFSSGQAYGQASVPLRRLIDLAGTCVFAKQSLGPILSLVRPRLLHRAKTAINHRAHRVRRVRLRDIVVRRRLRTAPRHSVVRHVVVRERRVRRTPFSEVAEGIAGLGAMRRAFFSTNAAVRSFLCAAFCHDPTGHRLVTTIPRSSDRTSWRMERRVVPVNSKGRMTTKIEGLQAGSPMGLPL